MGRPIKAGLSYFQKVVDYYDYFKLMYLINDYGPLGQTFFDLVISMVTERVTFLSLKTLNSSRRTFRLKSSRQSVTDGLTKKTLCYKLFSLVRT